MAKRLSRGFDRGYLSPGPYVHALRGELAAAKAAAAASDAAAARAKDKRRWATEASSDAFVRQMEAQRDCKAAESVALRACDGLVRAIDQRDQLYYQALHSNSLAAHTLEACAAMRLAPGSKAVLKQRKAAVAEQAASLRLAVKPHVAASLGCSHIPRPNLLVDKLQRVRDRRDERERRDDRDP